MAQASRSLEKANFLLYRLGERSHRHRSTFIFSASSLEMISMRDTATSRVLYYSCVGFTAAAPCGIVWGKTYAEEVA